MRIPGFAIHGMGDITVLDPASVPVYNGPGVNCMPGSLDVNGNTVICPEATQPVAVSTPPCLVGTGPLAPGQSYCVTTAAPTCPLNTVVSGSCLCPTGTALDPTSLMCLPASSLTSNTMLYAGLGLLFALIVLPQLFAGGKR